MGHPSTQAVAFSKYVTLESLLGKPTGQCCGINLCCWMVHLVVLLLLHCKHLYSISLRAQQHLDSCFAKKNTTIFSITCQERKIIDQEVPTSWLSMKPIYYGALYLPWLKTYYLRLTSYPVYLVCCVFFNWGQVKSMGSRGCHSGCTVIHQQGLDSWLKQNEGLFQFFYKSTLLQTLIIWAACVLMAGGVEGTDSA